MPRATITLWVNSDNNQLNADWQSSSVAQPPIFKQGDTVGVELHWVRNANTQGLAMEEVEWSPSVGLALAIGRIEAVPTYGTFSLTFGTGETAPIQFNATANDVEDALNDLTSVTTAGGVTVSKQGNSYRIVFNDAGVLANTLDYSDNDLFPSSSIGVTLARAGTSTVRAIYQVAIKQSPVAYTETFVDQESATPTISVIRNAGFAGDTKIWRLSIYPYPKEGTMVLGWLDDGVTKTTTTISATASGDDVAEAMNAASGAEDWTVKKVGIYSWDFSTSKVTITSPTVNGAGLLSFSAKYCELSLNTVEVENLLNGTVQQTAYLEVETTLNGVRQTLIQTPVTFVNDLIDEADYTIVSRSEVMPVDSVVRFDTTQTLTSGQKTQARQNIGAVGDTDIAALQATVDAIDGRLASSEGVMLTEDEYDAIEAATTPSITNPFITDSALFAQLTGYSQTGHSHIIANVTGLQTALDGKTNVGHTHPSTDITGLNAAISLVVATEIAGKANIIHTHAITDVSGLETVLNSLATTYAPIVHTHTEDDIAGLPQALSSLDGRLDVIELVVPNIPTSDEKAALQNGVELPSALNPYVTVNDFPSRFSNQMSWQMNGSGISHTTTDHYPLELVIVVEGVSYAVPARTL